MCFKKAYSIFYRCLHMLKRYKSLLVIALCFSIISIACNTISSLTLKVVIDEAIPNENIRLLWMLQFVFIICVLCDSLFGILSKRFSCKASCKVQNDLRRNIFDKLLHADYLSLQEEDTSNLITTMLYSIDNLEGVLSQGFTTALSNVISILVVVTIMFSLNVCLTILSLLVFPVLIIISSQIGKRIDQTNQKMQNFRTLVTKDVEEAVACMASIRDSGLNNRMSERFFHNTDQLAKTTLAGNTVFEIMNRASWTLVIVPYQAILYGLGGMLAIMYGAPTIGTLLIFANLTNSLIRPVMGLVQMTGDIALSMDAFSRIDRFLAIKNQQTQSFDEPIHAENYLELYSLSYCYPKQSTKVIDELSFSFGWGKSVILWGKSGSGKSTLLKLIAGLLMCPKETYMRKNQKKCWGYFPQNPTLFDTTLRDNFHLISSGITEDTMWDLLESVGMKQIIEKKPEALDCVVRRGDYYFSVGEYRRLCLAVFLAKHRDIYMFDEPTASLDQGSAQIIIRVLRALSIKGASLIISTHDQNVRAMGNQEIYMNEFDLDVSEDKEEG